ncbi:unnamed protein product, partial [Ectocarpus sp. 8 AP-2014]
AAGVLVDGSSQPVPGHIASWSSSSLLVLSDCFCDQVALRPWIASVGVSSFLNGHYLCLHCHTVVESFPIWCFSRSYAVDAVPDEVGLHRSAVRTWQYASLVRQQVCDSEYNPQLCVGVCVRSFGRDCSLVGCFWSGEGFGRTRRS